MTNYGLVIYRLEARSKIEEAFGRHVTNKEQNEFLDFLDTIAPRWLKACAEEYKDLNLLQKTPITNPGVSMAEWYRIIRERSTNMTFS